MVAYNRLRVLRGGLKPREIENEHWVLYPVNDGTEWALASKKTGGLVENIDNPALRSLVELLLMLDSSREKSDGDRHGGRS